jgi:acyl-CoA synthetase (AMP-forming)/AMP-acid ligase II
MPTYGGAAGIELPAVPSDCSGLVAGDLFAETIPGILKLRAERCPRQAFLQVWNPDSDEIDSLTYEGFFEKVCAAVYVLDQLGVKSGTRVAFLSHPSVDFFALSIAVVSMGAVSVNLNYRQPNATLVEMVKLTRSDYLLVGNPFQSQARAISNCVLEWQIKVHFIGKNHDNNVSSDGEKIDLPSSAPAGAKFLIDNYSPQPSDVALVFFTSGSTGLPKAVPHTHGELLWNTHAKLMATVIRDFPTTTTNDPPASLCFLPIFHVIGYTNNFLFNLYAGLRCLVNDLADSPAHGLSPALVAAGCRRMKPLLVDTVPWIVDKIAELLEAGEIEPDSFRSVIDGGYILFGGCSLTTGVSERLEAYNIRVCNHYGQTEVSGPAMMGMPGMRHANAIKPLPGLRYELLEEEGTKNGAKGIVGGKEGELVLLGCRSATKGYIDGDQFPRAQ